MDIFILILLFCCLVPLTVVAFMAQQLIRNVNNTSKTFRSLIEEVNGASTKKVSNTQRSKKKEKVKKPEVSAEDAEFREAK